MKRIFDPLTFKPMKKNSLLSSLSPTTSTASNAMNILICFYLSL
ncbi:hypothetical protein NOC27_3434 [Nitrosococcus oceani AFC27]|nr:hypothetical protein NOC27_3434 [Nitrosococcus oceani AFC27]